MADTLVLDTNAFNDRGLAPFLRAYEGRKVLPAVAASELFHHHAVRRRATREGFLEFLKWMKVTVEPLDVHRALLAVEAAGGSFPDLGMDALIAAHALAPGRVLVTNNPLDFPQVSSKVATTSLLLGS